MINLVRRLLPVQTRVIRTTGLLFLVGVLAGCASTSPGDPFEGYNRTMYSINSGLDKVILKPAAKAYKNYTPLAFQVFSGNFFSNLNDVWSGANNLLQAKPTRALNDWTRVLLNTVFGFGGIADPASEMGWEKTREDFGQTLGVWGLPTGPYLVLPVFGPSSIRGTAGFAVDWWTDPLDNVIRSDDLLIGAAVVRAIDTRAQFLGASSVLQGAALDEYSFVRDGYFQRRKNLIYDGDPPFDDDDEEPLPDYKDDD